MSIKLIWSKVVTKGFIINLIAIITRKKSL